MAGAETGRQAGRPEQAVGLLQQAAEEASEPRIRAEIHLKRGRLEWFCGRARQAERQCLDAVRLLEPTDPDWAALVLVEASLAAQDAGDASARSRQHGEPTRPPDNAKITLISQAKRH